VRPGAAAAVRRNDLLFMVDTQGLYPTDYLSRCTNKVLLEVSLQHFWPAGPAVKSSKIHPDNSTNWHGSSQEYHDTVQYPSGDGITTCGFCSY
jgi:hypothetical protein